MQCPCGFFRQLWSCHHFFLYILCLYCQLGPYKYRLCVTIKHWNSCASTANLEWGRSNRAVVHMAEDLLCLNLYLFLLLWNIRDDIVHDIKCDDARRPSCARKGLHRGHEHSVDAKPIKYRL